MDKIAEIIYLPSLRCNLNCQHCGENQDVPKEQELDCARVLEQIENSLLLEDMCISISGGEPFLNPGLGDFVVGLLRRTRHRVGITTNGYFTEAIAAMMEQLTAEEQTRIGFAISIDGLRDTHNAIRRNPQSFDRALKTLHYLAEQNAAINVNTVVQQSNLSEIPQMRALFAAVSPDIRQECIPIAVDISEDKRNIYDDAYLEAVWGWQYPDEAPESLLARKKALLSHGKYHVENCHAGRRNITIGPDGKVYTCLTGAYYLGKSVRPDFCLGDLRTQTLDEILTDLDRRNAVCNGAVAHCRGCSNPCEVTRERQFFAACGLSPEEVPAALRLERDRRLGAALLDYTGWDAIERDVADPEHRWCWSRDLAANIFVPVQAGDTALHVAFSKISPQLRARMLVDGKEAYTLPPDRDRVDAVLPLPPHGAGFVTVTFVTDRLCRPSELTGSPDTRALGICVHTVEACKG